MVRINGGVICTCSEWEICAAEPADRARTTMTKATIGNRKDLGQDNMGTPKTSEKQAIQRSYSATIPARRRNFRARR
jgi:hypothetical protein